MSSRSTLDGLLSALIEGWPFDLDSGESIKFLPAVHDRGLFEIGSGGQDMDLKVYLGNTAAYVLFDVGNQSLTLSNVTLTQVGNLGLTGDVVITGALNATGAVKFSTTSNTVGAATFGNTIDATLGITGSTLKINTTSNTVGAATFGNTVSITGNATLGSAAARPIGWNALSSRFELQWIPGSMRGKPGLATDSDDDVTATFMVTDPLFAVSGTNCASSCVTFSTDGGILLTTTAAANDQVILDAHPTANLSAWKQTSWLTNTVIEWECLVKTGADIVNSIIWAGLKLTNTPTLITDADQAFFRYETTVANSMWTATASTGDSDNTTETAVAVANSTAYHLKITVDGSLIPRFYINGALAKTGLALATNKSFIPVIGIQAIDAAAVSLIVRGQAISKSLS